MLMHIAKLIWNRKRANMLIITEVAITFIVLFALTYAALSNYQRYTTPLGFDWQGKWSIKLNTGARWNQENDTAQLQQIFESLKQQSVIDKVILSNSPIFENSRWTSSREINGIEDAYYQVNFFNAQGPQDFGIELVAGRWFGEQDNGQNYVDVMVNQRFVDAYLQGVEPVNFEYSDPDNPDFQKRRIVGVYQDFRQQGEFSEPMPYLLRRYAVEQGNPYGMRNIYISFNEPQTAAYEEDLLKLLKSIAPTWEFTIKPVAAKREAMINEVVMPLLVISVVVGFLLLMVAMGLFGVLWQNISRRTQEIGLRRALGASEGSIKGQIIGELVVIALFGISVALLILIQVPLLDIIVSMSWSGFLQSALVALMITLAMVVLCALYPSHTAINTPPAVALHYE